jgi:hypothetical protein
VHNGQEWFGCNNRGETTDSSLVGLCRFGYTTTQSNLDSSRTPCGVCVLDLQEMNTKQLQCGDVAVTFDLVHAHAGIHGQYVQLSITVNGCSELVPMTATVWQFTEERTELWTALITDFSTDNSTEFEKLK